MRRRGGYVDEKNGMGEGIARPVAGVDAGDNISNYLTGNHHEKTKPKTHTYDRPATPGLRLRYATRCLRRLGWGRVRGCEPEPGQRPRLAQRPLQAATLRSGDPPYRERPVSQQVWRWWGVVRARRVSRSRSSVACMALTGASSVQAGEQG